ncbi:hypothetical protein BD779DRAFT_1794806 [Infundibulicybe gibba]|nr:hypothetical protein BD779DRAFT_1794806 [Infundibulicybe gibba]
MPTTNRSPLSFLWFILSTFHFDRFRPRTFNPRTDLLDLTGKVVIVTGGNTGIGYSTAKHLARQGAKVYITTRNESKGTQATAQLNSANLAPVHGRVEFLELDLCDPRNAVKAAQEFLRREERLDILTHLVNNAAILIQHDPIYYDGILDYMAVNHFSPFVFTQNLLPLMKKTAAQTGSDVRIVNVSSDGHFEAPPQIRFRNLDDINTEYINDESPWYSKYAATKLANVLWTKELQRRLDSDRSPITVMSLHPGNVNTFAQRTQYPRLASVVMKLIFMPPDVGAYTTVFAAASPLIAGSSQYKGAYLQPVARLGEASETANDRHLAKELWDTTEDIVVDRKYIDS